MNAAAKIAKVPQRRWACPKCTASGWNSNGSLQPHQHYSRFGWRCDGQSIRKYKPGE